MKPHPILLPLAWVYEAGVRLRNLLFDAGVFRQRRSDVTVVSVGNVAVGGTGKTPFVEELSRRMRSRGVRVGVLSRGYGRSGRGQRVVSTGSGAGVPVTEAGDEAAMLAEHLPEVLVVVDRDRVAGARTAAKLGCEVLILDDGFQHRWLGRDLDIILVPAADLLNRPRMMPAGYLREPLSSLRRSQIIVISRCQGLDQFQAAAAKAREIAPRAQLVGVRHEAAGLCDARTKQDVEPGGLSSKEAVAVSGIADPASFERSTSSLGLQVMQHLIFADHHWYSGADLNKIAETCRKEGIDQVVTTEKDVVRMRATGPAFESLMNKQSVLTIILRLEVLEGEEVLEEIVEKVRGTARASF